MELAYSVQQIVLHPSYQASTLSADLALIQIAQGEDQESGARLVLPQAGDKFTDFGTVIGSGSRSNRLYHGQSDSVDMASLPITAYVKCRQLYGTQVLPTNVVCVGKEYQQSGLCQVTILNHLESKNDFRFSPF